MILIPTGSTCGETLQVDATRGDDIAIEFKSAESHVYIRICLSFAECDALIAAIRRTQKQIKKER